MAAGNSKLNRRFRAKSAEEEFALLRGDDSTFTNTRRYLGDLMSDVLEHFSIPYNDYKQLQHDLTNDITIAARRFLSNPRNDKRRRFNMYFSWYILQRLKHHPIPNLRGELKSIIVAVNSREEDRASG